MKIRELNLTFDYPNTALEFLSIYNQMARVGKLNKHLLSEVTRNISFISGNGLTGIMFGSTLHQNPAISPVLFSKNLYQMLVQNGLQGDDIYQRVDEVSRGAADLTEFTNQEKRVFNPFFDAKLSEWLGSVYGVTSKFADDFNTYRSLADGSLHEISCLADAIRVGKT